MATPQIVQNILEQAEALFHQGQFTAASQLLSDGIAQAPSAKLWNDWAAVQVSLANFQDAERAFHAALQLDPCSTLAAENLGALLFARGCHVEAAPLLRQSLAGASPQVRPVLEEMLVQCAAGGADSEPSPPVASVFDPASRQPLLPSALASRERGTVRLLGDDWCRAVFQKLVPAPGVRIAASWAEDSEWGLRAYNALALLECEYAAKLLAEIRDKNIQGDIAEFGIYQGWWINFLYRTTEDLGLHRRIYGFDSFEGLSDPHPEHDQAFWKKGQYACSLEQVSKNTQAALRPRLMLVKGFFEKASRSGSVGRRKVFIRSHRLRHLPARARLPSLSGLASPTAQSWSLTIGRTSAAMASSAPSKNGCPLFPTSNLNSFFYGAIGHFYTRVHHKK